MELTVNILAILHLPSISNLNFHHPLHPKPSLSPLPQLPTWSDRAPRSSPSLTAWDSLITSYKESNCTLLGAFWLTGVSFRTHMTNFGCVVRFFAQEQGDESVLNAEIKDCHNLFVQYENREFHSLFFSS